MATAAALRGSENSHELGKLLQGKDLVIQLVCRFLVASFVFDHVLQILNLIPYNPTNVGMGYKAPEKSA